MELKLDRDFEEYRVNFIGGKEATAYYTDDLEDAATTMLAMAKAKRESVCAQCREAFTAGSRIVTSAKDGASFHARCWSTK